MSAFFDIWIGSAGTHRRPLNTRPENEAWTRMPNEDYSCWQSLPSGKDFPFFRQAVQGQWRLMVLGQFYEQVDIQELLKRCSDYVQGATGTYQDPSGHYILFLLNSDNALYVFTNRLGTYHAYHATEPGRNTLSTYYLGLAKEAGNKELDWEGITAFFGNGFFNGDHTHLKQIKILSPASVYHFDKELALVSKKRYWNWHFDPVHRSEEEYTDMLHEALTASLAYAVKDHVTAMPISGGLDSRTIVGALDAQALNKEKKLWGYSYGYTRDSVETAIAARIAKARNIPFDKYVVPNYLFDKIDIIAKSIELFGYVDGPRQASMKEELEQRSELVIGGHWGDVWLDDMGIAGLPGNRQQQMTAAFHKKIFKKGGDWLLSVSNQYYPGGKEYLLDYYQKFIQQYDHVADPDYVMKIFKTDEWSFRWTLPAIRMYQAAVFPVLPFYDNRIVDMFQQVPTGMLKGRQLQIAYLKRHHPDLARITWQEYDANLYWYKYFNNRNLGYRVYKKLGRMIKGETPVLRSWEVFYLNEKGRSELEKVLLEPVFNDIVPHEKCKALLDDFYRNPSAANGYSVSMLHTFARFIEQIS